MKGMSQIHIQLFDFKIYTNYSVKSELMFTTGFSVGSVVKNLPTMQEMQVQSRGQEDALEKEMATHSSVLAWEIPWTEEPTVHGVAKSQT